MYPPTSLYRLRHLRHHFLTRTDHLHPHPLRLLRDARLGAHPNYIVYGIIISIYRIAPSL